MGTLETGADADAPEVEDTTTAGYARRYRSERGGFEIYTAPPLAPPPASADLTDDQVATMVGYFDGSSLVDETHTEAEVSGAIADMVRAISPGNIVTPLFDQGGPTGMSLFHAWFGPHFPLFRHSHPQTGDCLYYVVAGSAVLGSQVLRPGDGFFVPNGMPYKYRAGPEGVEVLEFRAGGGIEGAPLVQLYEPSLDSLKRIANTAQELQAEWGQPPARVADTPRPS
jgi:hypothetical protein